MTTVPALAGAYERENPKKKEECFRYAARPALGFPLAFMTIQFPFSEPPICPFTSDESTGERMEAFVRNMCAYRVILPFFYFAGDGGVSAPSYKARDEAHGADTVLGAVRLLMFWIAGYCDYRAITVAPISHYASRMVLTLLLAKEG